MKLTIAFFSIVLTLSFGACSTASTGTKVATFTPCCMTGQPEKAVVLESNSFAPGGDVVRLVH